MVDKNLVNKVTKKKRLLILGQRLNELRGELSQADFAKRVGLTAATIGYYENSERLPDAETLKKIADKTGVSADWLLGRTDDKKGNADTMAVEKRLGLSPSTQKKLVKLTGSTGERIFDNTYTFLVNAFICDMDFEKLFDYIDYYAHYKVAPPREFSEDYQLKLHAIMDTVFGFADIYKDKEKTLDVFRGLAIGCAGSIIERIVTAHSQEG